MLNHSGNKLDRSKTIVYLGIDPKSGAHLVYSLHTKRVQTARDIVLNEQEVIDAANARFKRQTTVAHKRASSKPHRQQHLQRPLAEKEENGAIWFDLQPTSP